MACTFESTVRLPERTGAQLTALAALRKTDGVAALIRDIVVKHMDDLAHEASVMNAALNPQQAKAAQGPSRPPVRN